MTRDPANPLRGRIAVVAGDGVDVVPVCHHLLALGVSLLVVAPDRDAVHAAVAGVSDPALVVVPITADPTSAEVWDRLVPHAEQRLGPIDIAIAIGVQPIRDLAHDRLVADMVRRGHGVFVECDAEVSSRDLPPAIRYRFLARTTHDLAADILTVVAGD